MKRLLVLLCAVAILVALPLSHFAEKGVKVDVCHVNAANDTLAEFGLVFYFGNVINVSENAVKAHEKNGDSVAFLSLDENLRVLFENFFGISIPNADCYFYVY